MYRKQLQANTKISKVQQIVNLISDDIEKGILKRDRKLPSINQFSSENGVGRDTIEKAYTVLKRRQLIASYPGRGYFVLGNGTDKISVLLVFNKLSSFKKLIFDGFTKAIGKKATVDLQIHHYDIDRLAEILETNRGRYDFTVIMPHFFAGTDVGKIKKVLQSVPSHELVLLDKYVAGLAVAPKAVYQDFRQDVYDALQTLSARLSRYDSITLLMPKNIHHPPEIVEGINMFCKEKKLKFLLREKPASALKANTVYITTDEDDLAQLIRQVRKEGWVLGKNLGIISFNETAFKELLDITVISTDFLQMGHTAVSLIFEKGVRQSKNPFMVIDRGSV
jgi:DNA-binding transcriptional regulator YhcF (GntR family)